MSWVRIGQWTMYFVIIGRIIVRSSSAARNLRRSEQNSHFRINVTRNEVQCGNSLTLSSGVKVLCALARTSYIQLNNCYSRWQQTWDSTDRFAMRSFRHDIHFVTEIYLPLLCIIPCRFANVHIKQFTDKSLQKKNQLYSVDKKYGTQISCIIIITD